MKLATSQIYTFNTWAGDLNWCNLLRCLLSWCSIVFIDKIIHTQFALWNKVVWSRLELRWSWFLFLILRIIMGHTNLLLLKLIWAYTMTINPDFCWNFRIFVFRFLKFFLELLSGAFGWIFLFTLIFLLILLSNLIALMILLNFKRMFGRCA